MCRETVKFVSYKTYKWVLEAGQKEIGTETPRN
jgi:hypothetical protein